MKLKDCASVAGGLLLALLIVVASPILLLILLARAMRPSHELREWEGSLRTEQARMARKEPEEPVDRPPAFLRTGC